ncbi:hypothetical protein AAXB25_14300 [Paenibacillus lautus]|uniref:hypothetical protein n=1 Tax=Paenibacillus lautus TaxID=1401 RepID=UPI003D27AC5B
MDKFHEEAKKRIPTHRERILNAFRGAGYFGVTNIQLKEISQSWWARVQELYTQGFKINVEQEGNGVCRYVLISEPKEVLPKPENATDMILNQIDEQFDGNVTRAQLKKMLEEMNFRVIRNKGFHKAV